MVDDAIDISSKTSTDCNSNNIPDECDVRPSNYRINQIASLSGTGNTNISSPYPSFVKFADLDNDNDLDFVVVSSKYIISVYENLGGRNFAKRADASFSNYLSSSEIVDLEIGKFSSSGLADIVVALQYIQQTPGPQTKGFSIRVFKNLGGFNFNNLSGNALQGEQITLTDYPDIFTGFKIGVGGLIAHDFDADGKSELLIHGSSATISSKYFVLITRPDGSTGLSFSKESLFEYDSSIKEAKLVTRKDESLHDYHITLLDFNGSLNGIYGDLSGSTLTWTSHSGLGKSNISSAITGKFSTGSTNRESLAFTLADKYSTLTLPKEKQQILVQQMPNSLVQLAPNKFNGINKNFNFIDLGSPRQVGIFEAFDVNKDGLDDILAPTEAGLRILFADSEGVFNNSTLVTGASSSFKNFLGSADVDSDGELDLFFGDNASVDIKVAFMKNEATWQNAFSRDRSNNSIPDECERTVLHDFSGDGRSDEVVTRAESGLWKWFIRDFSGGDTGPIAFGLSGQGFTPYVDVKMPGDFSGSGVYRPGVVRDFLGGLYWYNLADDGVTAVQTQWGLSGDTPLVGHFDTDKKMDRVVARNWLGGIHWFIRTADTSHTTSIPWGLSGDTPLVGDVLNGDGIDDLIVVRKENGGYNWYINSPASLHSGTGETKVIQWGLSSDILPSVHDVNGDGASDLIVYRLFGGFLYAYVRYGEGSFSGSVNYEVFQLGLYGDFPGVGTITDIPYFSKPYGNKVPQLCVYRSGTAATFFGQRYVLTPSSPTDLSNNESRDGFYGLKSDYFGIVGDRFVKP